VVNLAPFLVSGGRGVLVENGMPDEPANKTFGGAYSQDGGRSHAAEAQSDVFNDWSRRMKQNSHSAVDCRYVIFASR